MITEMFTIPDSTFKDDTPVNTVMRIKGILKTYGIETEEQWNESGVPNCYSVRVSVFGTVFGVNGKGVTKEFALASGYGELMERLQLGRIFKADQQKSGGPNVGSPDDIYLSTQELLKRNQKWYALLAEKAKQNTGTTVTAEEIIEQYEDVNGNTPVTRFCCINTNTEEYLPTVLLNSIYTTNGCAAGNTIEEALVQAISEIVERYFSMRILSEEIEVPDIPEEVLKSCKIAYEIITFLRGKSFHVIVKDCSLGTKFPVVCVCLIDRKTGRYHTHFGAYPHFEIALQRTLTEAFQGRDIQKVAHFENFSKRGDGLLNKGNLLNQLVKGASEKSPDFFVGESEKYTGNAGFEGRNNRELLKECINFFKEQGYDILVRDCSCLGFPTCQVIIPGYSEVFVYRLIHTYNDLRYHKFAEKVLKNPPAATIEEIMGFMMNQTQIAKWQLPPVPFVSQANIPAQMDSIDQQYLFNATVAYLNYALGRKKETIKYIDKMLSADTDKDIEQLICIKRYLMLSADGYEEDRIRTILECFHQPHTVQWLFSAISENKNLLDPFVLHCDMKCHHSCILYDTCRKKQTETLVQLIRKKQQEMDHSIVGTQLAQLLYEKQ